VAARGREEKRVSQTYQEFLARKLAHQVPTGIPDPPPLNPKLKPHQQHCTRWALQRGRAALFQGCGLGKTWQGLEWAAKVSHHTRRPVLILTPLAVAGQWIREAHLLWGDGWGPAPTQLRTAADVDGNRPLSYVANYERLDKLEELLPRLGGIVLDESSILKNASGKTRTQLIETFRDTPFKLCLTATPSPNDPAELGSHAEFLGLTRHVDMLQRFFEHDGSSTGDWLLKGHARKAFWRWVATWAICLNKPSDLGFSDEGYNLPPLELHEHVVDVDLKMARRAGLLFAYEAVSLSEQREVKRESLEERVAKAAELANGDREQWLIWASLNDESTALTKAIDGAIEVTGSQSIDEKEERITRFLAGDARVLVTKTSVAGFGLNAQCVSRQIFVGPDHSFEQSYQAIRRSYRFGQKNPVHVHQICTSADGRVTWNLQRKRAEFDRMHREMAEVIRAS
jgi:superfamily II DNA or RNA helicase